MTCGGTRAARYAAEGNLAEAWRYNPLSILVVYGAGLAILRAAVGLLVRRWVTLTVGWTPGRRRWAIAVLIMLVALPIKTWALFTMNKQGWLTRKAGMIGG